MYSFEENLKTLNSFIYTMGPEQSSHQIVDCILKRISVKENVASELSLSDRCSVGCQDDYNTILLAHGYDKNIKYRYSRNQHR